MIRFRDESMASESNKTASGKGAEPSPVFIVGQVVRRRGYGYRAVIVDCDPVFLGDDTQTGASPSAPPHDQPWYYILPDSHEEPAYAAQSELYEDFDKTPISHPLIPDYFKGFIDGYYLRDPIRDENDDTGDTP